MIQRIQTVYLLLIVILSGFILFSPIADLISLITKLTYLVDFKGISLVKPTGNTLESNIWGVTTISAVVPIIALITIFSYKNRVKQIRLSVINMIFMVGYYVVLFSYLWPACSRLQADCHLRITAVLPIINLILTFLAIGAIGKDENLVKSLDRLR